MAALPDLALWLAAGIALGAVYLRLLARTVAAFTGAGGSGGAGAVWLLLRVALAAGAFWAAARHGALPLLSMLLGFLVARTVAIRRAREAGDDR